AIRRVMGNSSSSHHRKHHHHDNQRRPDSRYASYSGPLPRPAHSAPAGPAYSGPAYSGPAYSGPASPGAACQHHSGGVSSSSGGGGGGGESYSRSSSFGYSRALQQKYGIIPDTFRSIAQVQEKLREVGLESSNLIVAVDFTKSNEWTGKQSFNGRSLHAIAPGASNPYEQAIDIIGQTLSAFDEDNLIPCYGFGDVSTHDKAVFAFNEGQRPCNGFEEALQRYRAIAPLVQLSGAIAPLVQLSGAIAPLVQLSGAIAPLVQLSGAIAPLVQLSGAIAPLVQLSGAIAPLVQLSGAIAPLVQLSGAIAPLVQLSGAIAPLVQLSGFLSRPTFPFNPFSPPLPILSPSSPHPLPILSPSSPHPLPILSPSSPHPLPHPYPVCVRAGPTSFAPAIEAAVTAVEESGGQYPGQPCPTSFAPAIEAAVRAVEESGGQYHVLLIIADGQVTRSVDTPPGVFSRQEQATVDAIVAASNYALSIVMVGVGDGPWDTMEEFDDALPQRNFDNFQEFDDALPQRNLDNFQVGMGGHGMFVNFMRVMASSRVPDQRTSLSQHSWPCLSPPLPPSPPLSLPPHQFVNFTRVMASSRAPEQRAALFALSALMEVPHQYRACTELGLLGRPMGRMPPSAPKEPPPRVRAADAAAAQAASLAAANMPPHLNPNNLNPSDFNPGTTPNPFGNFMDAPAAYGYGAGSSATPTGAAAAADSASGSGGASAAGGGTECPVCLMYPKNTAFQCGHQTCEECGKQMNNCPICRAPITMRIKLYS
ncbi:unnamed protein product, partial [Closterium sp. NIES-65]